jgi:TetR/AcrR family transcriptional regulator, mexJK operon transcriptional repressor
VNPLPTTRRLDKRRAILEAAAELFGELGFERASVDAIAAKANVSKPTIYSHFGTKEQLFRDSLAESSARINSELMAAIRGLDVGPTSWRQALYDLGDSLVQCHQSECAQSVQRQIYAEIKRDPEVFNAVRTRAAEPVIEALAGKLARLGNAGYLRISDPVLAAKQFIALTNAELTELTELGTRRAAFDEVHRAAAAGVDLFLAAFAA